MTQNNNISSKLQVLDKKEAGQGSMKVVIELSEKEIECLVEAIGYPIENEYDAECSLHLLIENCM